MLSRSSPVTVTVTAFRCNKRLLNSLNSKLVTKMPDFDPDVVLSKPLMAHLASSSPNGPCDSPVWYLWEDGAIWLIGNSGDSFPKRLRAEPRCAIGVVDFDADRGVLRHVGIRGVAAVQEMNQPRLERLLTRYLGGDKNLWNKWFTENIVDGLDLMICVTPETEGIVARDMSYFKTGPALVP